MHTVRIVLTAAMALAVAVPGLADKDPASEFKTRLERVAKNPSLWDTVRVEADGRLAKDVRSLTVYGRGVGIWNGERQFSLTEKEVGTVLRLLVEGGFADLPELLGGEEDDEDGGHEKPLDRHPPRGEAPRYLLRTLTVSLDGLSRTVIQEAEVPEARPLVALLSRLVETCRKPAATGITAPDLATGLTMVAEGTLAPETLTIHVNAPQLRSLPSQDGQGWILELRHGRLSSSSQLLGKGVVSRTERRMSDGEIRELARKLLAVGAATLPQRVNTSGYTQLTLQVLNRKLGVMARTYAGTPGAEEKKTAATFARVRAILHALHGKDSPGK